jgi:ketosteroid isomerase-like protein
MEATVNKQAAINGYEAFGAMDPDGAMKDMSDSIEWVVAGDSSVSGTYRGKADIGAFWMKLVEKGFTTTPRQFIADGDKVAVLVDIELAGERSTSMDLLSFDPDGKLIRFESFGEEAMLNRAFPR